MRMLAVCLGFVGFALGQVLYELVQYWRESRR